MKCDNAFGIDDSLFALRASWVAPVTAGDGTRLICDGVVVVKGKTIESVGAYSETELSATVPVIHLEGQLLIPGLINCHTHAAMSLLRGFADDMGLHEWLSSAVWPAEARFVNPDYVKLGTKLAVYEFLKTGTTCFVDQYFFSEFAAEVSEQIGIRIACGDPIIDLKDGSLPSRISKALEQAYSRNHDPEYVFRILNPHSCYTVPVDGLERLAREASTGGFRVNIHLHESQHECDHYADTHGGKTAFQSLIDAGLFNSNMIAAHCVCLSETERQQLATHKVNVVHCPKSNMKLANGVCPVQSLLKAGVNVALGTDSACSNNGLSMISEMQAAALVGKTVRCPKLLEQNGGVLAQHANGGDATAVSCHTVLRMATYNGAIALGREKELGSLEPGKLADIVAVDLNSLECLPIFDPISTLVYSTGAKVSNVWIGGRQMVKGGTVIAPIELDPEEVKAMGREIAAFQAQRKLEQNIRI